MLELTILLVIGFIVLFSKTVYQKQNLIPVDEQSQLTDDFCVIDIRDYISAYRSPYPGAENIPLDYLPRALKGKFNCPKKILLVTDNKRGARLAARMIKRKRGKSVYYIKAV
ncbi:rhodanese-like domain-containing protein [Halobacillus sp. Marseille-Q1614]|uniref:rhodanese-like domain-containing protein n=1 Tax=Halobacillus sp. Marseille-Q1614 TaxID=2709134 RepID=UPI00156D70A7|nr:rhodanese-like domain-containing protein [Halobacillus sp. Marseille-Q1614]